MPSATGEVIPISPTHSHTVDPSQLPKEGQYVESKNPDICPVSSVAANIGKFAKAV